MFWTGRPVSSRCSVHSVGWAHLVGSARATSHSWVRLIASWRAAQAALDPDQQSLCRAPFRYALFAPCKREDCSDGFAAGCEGCVADALVHAHPIGGHGANSTGAPVRISIASAPSRAVTVSWPSIAMARATRARIASSSSAIRMRAICESLADSVVGNGERGWSGNSLCAAVSDIAAVEETDVDAAGFGGWRGQARFERRALAGLEH